jgi:hypothetical protein
MHSFAAFGRRILVVCAVLLGLTLHTAVLSPSVASAAPTVASATGPSVSSGLRQPTVSDDSVGVLYWKFISRHSNEFSCDASGAWQVMWTAATDWACYWAPHINREFPWELNVWI